MLLQAMANSLKAKRKIETLKRKYKEESNGNFCTKNTITEIKVLTKWAQ